jgi:hypothetical protein
MHTLSRLPCWVDRDIAPEFDISRLRPPNLSKGNRFETECDARNIATRNVIPGLRANLPQIAEKIAECVEGGEYCLVPVCPLCARRYRLFFFSEVLQIYKQISGEVQTATIFLKTCKAGTLGEVSLEKVHTKFRKRLQRCDFKGAALIGGTEVSYRHEPHEWLLHLHLLSIGASEEAWGKLENMMAKSGMHDPLRRKPIEDHVEQFSYLQKFHTYHRPGKTLGTKRARAYPLKGDRLRELTLWMNNYDFENSTFCFGVRRRHGKFYIEHGSPHAAERESLGTESLLNPRASKPYAYAPTCLRARKTS